MMDVTIDTSSKRRKLGDKVKRVFERVRPVVRLLHALVVSLNKFGIVIERCDTHAKLGHGVERAWEAMRANHQHLKNSSKGIDARVNQVSDIFGQFTILCELAGQVAGLLLARYWSPYNVRGVNNNRRTGILLPYLSQ